MRKKSTLILLSLFFTSFVLLAQINTGEYPPSFYTQSEKSNQAIPIYQVEKPNIESLKKEDKADEALGLKPWRFGALVGTNITLNNSGVWIDDDNSGYSTWKLQLKASGAESINLNFRKFFLTNGAQLFFYNNNYKDVLGAITSRNNKNDSLFSIRPIKGEKLNIELYAPTSEIARIQFEIEGIVYGYRSLHEKAMKAFNGSGSCNINVNCEEGDNWQDAKRSVAIITKANNTRQCTGTLLNNVRQDTTPYFLTAAHCGTGNNAIFIFNYESANCSPTTDGILSNSISGASPKAISNSSQPDFHLFELSSRPPSSYNVYYSGWSAVDAAAPLSSTIHHPTGDVKKISINTDSVKSSRYNGYPPDYHWSNNWEKGTTELGSSGSPLFDQNQRVIGQLHGGDASCNNKFAADYYGKFAISWNSNSTKSRQLKAWLDPDTTNTLVLDGLDPNAAIHNNDIQLLNIYDIQEYQCDSTITPKISVRNKGNNDIDSIEIEYKIDNNTAQTIRYTNKIIRNQVEEITLPTKTLTSGLHQLDLRIRILPLSISDQDTTNNSSSLTFRTNRQPVQVNFKIKTDDYGDETYWRINDQNGNELFNGGPFESRTGGSIESQALCLYDNCFDLVIFDSYGDGFNGNGQFGNGYVLITDGNGDTLVFENNFTTAQKTINFCVSPFTSIGEVNFQNIEQRVFPNPVERGGLLSIVRKHRSPKNYNYEIIDGSGRLRMKFNDKQVNLNEGITPGIYFLLTKDNNGRQVKAQKLIVQ